MLFKLDKCHARPTDVIDYSEIQSLANPVVFLGGGGGKHIPGLGHDPLSVLLSSNLTGGGGLDRTSVRPMVDPRVFALGFGRASAVAGREQISCQQWPHLGTCRAGVPVSRTRASRRTGGPSHVTTPVQSPRTR